jgi:exodeoxyribonuclease VII small subunit
VAGAESNTERENTETRYENTEGGMKASLKAEAPEEWTIEEALQELDDIVEKLESRDISLEQSFSIYQKGMELLRQCSGKIDTVEKKMLKISGDGEISEF